MLTRQSFAYKNKLLVFSICYLLAFSVAVLYSLAQYLFPSYFIYIVFGFIAFLLFFAIDFEIMQLFSTHLYIFSIVLLFLPLIIGQATRGTIRWIPLGPVQIQPSEIVRPFLLLFWAQYLTTQPITMKRFVKFAVLLLFPVFLILIQPSLGVSVLTAIGAFGIVLSSSIPKKYISIAMLGGLLLIPLFWLTLAPYQRTRVTSFLNPERDPFGAGYNSIQSMISVGSGGLFGRGLGEGVQTQLQFLPEKHTDFIFASLAEELGLAGVLFLFFGLFLLFWSIISVVGQPVNPTARAYASGVFLFLFAETFVHIGMNMALLPITGVPLPLVSAGGSSLMATLVTLAIVARAKE